MTWDIRPEAVILIRAMAGTRADRYAADILLPGLSKGLGLRAHSVADIREGMTSPFQCLQAIFAHYAFSRRGKERAELSEVAVAALRRLTEELDFDQFLKERDATRLWACYLSCCEQTGRKPMEQLNRGVIAGLAELAQEAYRAGGSGSIALWLADGIVRTGRVEPQFMRMVDIRSVGPKLASVLARDVTFLFDIEDRIDPVDRLYVQPIDKHLRAFSHYVVDELAEADAADWILAGKLAKYARRADASGIRFNMGATFYGSREAPTPALFEAGIRQIIAQAKHTGSI